MTGNHSGATDTPQNSSYCDTQRHLTMSETTSRPTVEADKNHKNVEDTSKKCNYCGGPLRDDGVCKDVYCASHTP